MIARNIHQPVSALRQRSLLWGYVAIVLIAVFSTIGNAVYHEIFDLPSKGRPSYPFVIFSVAIFCLICLMRPLLLVIRRHPEPLRQLRQDPSFLPATPNRGSVVDFQA